jgi:mutator protein MutT
MKKLTLLFLVRDNQILLAMKKRGFGKDRWNGVGGKLESNETLRDAVIRECKEEINVTPTKFKKMAEIEFDQQHLGVKETLYVYAYIASHWDGEPVETEEMAPKWFKISEIPYDEMWADDKYWLPLILNGNKLQCKFILDENDKIIGKEIVEA